MKDKGIAHIGIGAGKGDDKAAEAVKMAVASPLLETTISGATHVIINVSGDISLADAAEAADYVQELAGDDVNIIFGAMYDSTQTDSCTITVIATGIVDNTVHQPRSVGGFGFKTPGAAQRAGVVSPISQATGGQTAVPRTQGINKPTDIHASVEAKTLNIPSFLQKK